MSSGTDKQAAPGADLKKLAGRLAGAMMIASAVCFLFTLLWGFEWRNLFGFAVGGANACGGMFYLAHTCERAVECSTQRAKRMMLACYGVRLTVLTALCAVGFLTGLLSVVGVIVPQLYPRILLTFDKLLGINYF